MIVNKMEVLSNQTKSVKILTIPKLFPYKKPILKSIKKA